MMSSVKMKMNIHTSMTTPRRPNWPLVAAWQARAAKLVTRGHLLSYAMLRGLIR